jgi:hypothetical protein
VPTSKRSQIDDAQYPRIPTRILKGAPNEEVVDFKCIECRDTQISYIAAKSLAEPLEVCRPQEGLKTKAPKYPEVLGRAIRRASHREAFIPDVKSWVSRSGWLGLQEHTNLGRLRIQDAQLGWQGHRHTRGTVRPMYLPHADLKEVVLVSRRPT